MIRAIKIRSMEGWQGDATLYRLSEEISWGGCYDGDATGETDHVIVSAAVVPYTGPETYIFPADAEGNVMDWSEMHGSYRGGLSHEHALERADWSLQEISV